MATAQDVINEAAKWAKAKYKEGHNNDSVFGRWYGANHVAWCAMFVSYCMNKAGAGNLIAGAQTKKGYASCGAGIKFFKKKKAWHSARDAQPGDHVFFDWDHDLSQDHVGIVVKNDPKKKQMITIEGNTSSGAGGSQSNGEGVYKRVRYYSNIMGVGRPAYTKAKAPVPPVAPKAATPSIAPVAQPAPVALQEPAIPATPVVKPVVAPVVTPRVTNPGYGGHLIQKGSHDVARVKYIQQQLHLKVDGVFDSETDAVVKSLQRKHGLTADGIVGPRTWAALK